jgi:hypothetical protein
MRQPRLSPSETTGQLVGQSGRGQFEKSLILQFFKPGCQAEVQCLSMGKGSMTEKEKAGAET